MADTPMATTSSLKEVPLKHLVLTILSLAAERGKTQIPYLEFYRIFAELTEEFPEEFPPIVFTKTSYSAYSKRLDDALQSLIGSSIDLPNPRLRFLVIPQDLAGQHLKWLQEKHGTAYIDNMKPIVDRFVSKL